jgi:hypothetical protein
MKALQRLRSRAARPECCGRGQLALASSGAGLLVGVAISSYDLETAEYVVLWLVVVGFVGLALRRALQNGKGWDSHDY